MSRTLPLPTKKQQEATDPPFSAASALLTIHPQLGDNARVRVGTTSALKDSNRFYVEVEGYRLQLDGSKPLKRSASGTIETSEARSHEDAPLEIACRALPLDLLTSRDRPRRQPRNHMEPLLF